MALDGAMDTSRCMVPPGCHRNVVGRMISVRGREGALAPSLPGIVSRRAPWRSILLIHACGNVECMLPTQSHTVRLTGKKIRFGKTSKAVLSTVLVLLVLALSALAT